MKNILTLVVMGCLVFLVSVETSEAAAALNTDWQSIKSAPLAKGVEKAGWDYSAAFRLDYASLITLKYKKPLISATLIVSGQGGEEVGCDE